MAEPNALSVNPPQRPWVRDALAPFAYFTKALMEPGRIQSGVFPNTIGSLGYHQDIPDRGLSCPKRDLQIDLQNPAFGNDWSQTLLSPRWGPSILDRGL